MHPVVRIAGVHFLLELKFSIEKRYIRVKTRKVHVRGANTRVKTQKVHVKNANTRVSLFPKQAKLPIAVH